LGLLNHFYNLKKGSQTLTVVENPLRGLVKRLAYIGFKTIFLKVNLTPMRNWVHGNIGTGLHNFLALNGTNVLE
jgi:hypothetical protein